MKSKIKALIFDLDGTLADTIPAITEAVNMTLFDLGLPPRTQIEVESFIGQGPRHLISESLPADKNNAELLDKALKLYDQNYALTYLHTDSLYDGMKDVLTTLSKNYKIAVLSNKQDEYVKELIKQLIPDGICEFAYGTINGIPAKPNPTTALKLASALEVDPSECVLIGDSEIDIATAKNAGFDCISVTWGYADKRKLLENGAQNTVGLPTELLDYFN